MDDEEGNSAHRKGKTIMEEQVNLDPRIKDFIGQSGSEKNRVQLIAFPSDEGVRRNGGRPGASRAPQFILEQFLKMTPHATFFEQHTSVLRKTASPVFVECMGDVEKDQHELGRVVSGCLGAGRVPVILGGGHETSFGHFLGYAGSGIKTDILNIDAHTDVRALKKGLAHSGSPFWQAIEHKSGLCKSYNVFGLNPATVSGDHFRFVEKQGEAVFEKETDLNRVISWFTKNRPKQVMVTMDMDAVQQSDAPGVSAPNASGIGKQLWLQLAFEFGKQHSVGSFDLCEVNPEFDRDGQTVKLAALTLWHFLLGVSLRDSEY